MCHLYMGRFFALFEAFSSAFICFACLIFVYIFNYVNSPEWVTKDSIITNQPLKDHVWATYYSYFKDNSDSNIWNFWNLSNSTISVSFSPMISPKNGLYNSTNKAALISHFDQLTYAGIKGIIIPWIGLSRLSSDASSFLDLHIKELLNTAKDYQIKIGIIIPKYEGRTWNSIFQDIESFKSKFITYRNMLRFQKRPVVIIEDSHELPNTLTYLQKVRRSRNDCFFIGSSHEESDLLNGIEDGFDAMTSVSITDSDSWASKSSNWRQIVETFAERGASLIPSISPVSNDNNRNGGKFYQTTWEKAIESQAHIFLINSFNNWFENTSIEFAKSGEKSQLSINNWAENNSTAFIDISKTNILKVKGQKK